MGPRVEDISDLITKLQWKLYGESGFTVREIGEIFKVSGARVQQRLSKAGYTLRKCGGGKTITPKWQRDYLARLISYGLTIREARNIVGIKCKVDIGREDVFRGRNRLPFSSPAVRRVWSEFTRLLIIKMWNDGATMNQICQILGYKNRNVLVSVMRRIRDNHTDLKRRRAPKQSKISEAWE